MKKKFKKGFLISQNKIILAFKFSFQNLSFLKANAPCDVKEFFSQNPLRHTAAIKIEIKRLTFLDEIDHMIHNNQYIWNYRFWNERFSVNQTVDVYNIPICLVYKFDKSFVLQLWWISISASINSFSTANQSLKYFLLKAQICFLLSCAHQNFEEKIHIQIFLFFTVSVFKH